MIRILDKTSNLWINMSNKSNIINSHKPSYISYLTTSYNTCDYGFNKSKKEIYEHLGFSCDDIPKQDISIYFIWDKNGINMEIELYKTTLSLLNIITNIDIIIYKTYTWNRQDIPDTFSLKEKYDRYEIIIHEVRGNGGVGISRMEVYINNEKISLVDNSIELTVKYAVRRCITEIVNKSRIDNVESITKQQLKELLTNQQQQIDELKQQINDLSLIKKSIADVLGLSDDAAIKQENEELKSTIADLKNQLEEYKKLITDARNLFNTTI